MNNERNIRTEGTLQRNGNNWIKSFILLLKFLSALKKSTFFFSFTQLKPNSTFQPKLISRRARAKQNINPLTHTHWNKSTHWTQTTRKETIFDRSTWQLGNTGTNQHFTNTQIHLLINLCVMHWIYTKQTNKHKHGNKT